MLGFWGGFFCGLGFVGTYGCGCPVRRVWEGDGGECSGWWVRVVGAFDGGYGVGLGDSVGNLGRGETW